MLQKERQAIRRSADQAMEESDVIFNQVIQLMKKKQSEVERLIRSQQQTEESRVEELQEKLEQEVTELRRKHSDLAALSGTTHHSQFLHNSLKISKLNEPKDSPRIFACPLRNFEDVAAHLSDLKDKLEHTVNEEWVNISDAVNKVDILLSSPLPQPTTREQFLKYSRNITLDENTAHTLIVLFDGNSAAGRGTRHQEYPKHPDRFKDSNMVLSRDSLTGRCYWEVEKSNATKISILVAYKNIDRNGYHSFYKNDKLWGFSCYKKTPYLRIGVYLDHRAGVLSFYNVSETMTLIQKIQTTFTQPLYAGFSFEGVSEIVKFCKLK